LKELENSKIHKKTNLFAVWYFKQIKQNEQTKRIAPKKATTTGSASQSKIQKL
jgi:hypothetical protein